MSICSDSTIKSACFGIFLTLSTFVYSVSNGAWSPCPAEPIADCVVANNAIVSSCYDSTHNTLFAAWPDATTLNPLYSIYQEGSWCTAGSISNDSEVRHDVFLCHNKIKEQVMAIWMGGDNNPYFSIYSSGSWGEKEALASDCIYETATLYYDSVREKVFAGITSSTGVPMYDWYDDGFHGVAIIDEAASVFDKVFICSDGNTVVAAWADRNTRLPIYSVYNRSTGAWSAGVPITTLYTVTENIYLSYNSKNQQVVATWGGLNKNNRPVYATFNGTAWSAHGTFDVSTGAFGTVFNTYDSSDDNQVFSGWSDKKNYLHPTYSIFRRGVWYKNSEIDPIKPSDRATNVFLTYNSTDDLVLATWANTKHNAPVYAIYEYCGAEIQPPIDLYVMQKRYNSGFGIEWCNVIEWDSSPSPEVMSYRIYRNDILVATIDARSCHYIDHDQVKKETVNYSVCSTDDRGNESAAATITIN